MIHSKGNSLLRLAALVALLMAALGAPPVPVAHAATYTVCAVGCDFITIQAAIDGTVNDDTISVTDATHTEAGITVDKNLTIQGQGASNTTVQANAARGVATDRVFFIAAGSTVTIKDMTIRHGNVTGSSGGGIYNDGTLTLENVTVKDNDASSAGGGIKNDDCELTLTNCTVSGNEAGSSGGGICNDEDGDVTLVDSTVSDNKAGEDGGGIDNYDGDVTLNNCTVSGNEASEDGGGIDNYDGNVTLNNCTVSDNKAGNDGGGIYNDGGDTEFKNTIIANNTATGEGPDCDGDLDSYGYNLVGNGTGCPNDGPGDKTTTDPKLDPLADNGGPTFTHALLAGSPALDAIPEGAGGGGYNGAPATDQRGVSRPQPTGGACDIGAFEAGPPILRVNKAGSGDGTVTSDVAGINCGTDCAEWYDEDTPVTLTVTPDGDSAFAGWSGDADCSDGQVTMDADKTCTATFDQAQPPEPVGVVVVPVNKVGLVVPWLGLAALAGLAALTVALVRRRKTTTK